MKPRVPLVRFNSIRLIRILVVTTIALSGAVSADETQSHVADSSRAESNKQDSAAINAAREAASWGLSEREWVRYQDLMKHSPRGNWTPTLDPLTVLGIEAKTPEERQRYAELYVRLDHARLEREKAFITAVTSAQARLYPGEKPFDFQLRPRMSGQLAAGDRLVLVTQKTCNDCGDRISKLLGRLGNDNVLDVFVVGLKDDAELRRWATDQHVDIDAVKQGRITLNHDRGEMLTMRLHESALPAVLKRSPSGAIEYYQP